jgi:hypothetical protein
MRKREAAVKYLIEEGEGRQGSEDGLQQGTSS